MSLLSLEDANQRDQFLIEQPPPLNEIIEFDDPTLSMLKDPSLLTGMKKKEISSFVNLYYYRPRIRQ